MTAIISSETTADKPGKDGARKVSKAERDKILKLARTRYTRAMEHERENIKLAYEDLEFMAGKQWPEDVANERSGEGRPVLTVNQMPQFVHQVTGDIRQMKPAIKVVAVDDQADPKMADLRQGMIRYIENRSDASGIYFQAADSQVACGIGHWRIETEYADDTTFEQELRISGVDDGVSVLWDPDAKRLTREDAMFCFVPVDMTLDAFKEKYPDASLDEFEEVKTWKHYSDWKQEDTVRVAEYWVKKPKTMTLALTPDGQTIDCTNDDDFDGGYTAEQKLNLCVKNGATVEKRETYEVCRYLITCADILEGPEEWAGRFIPIIPVIGEEVKIGRKLIRRGIIREAKDPQRQYNYFTSAQTEVVALQPKAPFLLTEVNVGKYQGMWETANTKNWPYMLWTPDAKNGGQQPSRIPPAVSSQGITEGLALANEDMRRVIGIYDASLGAKSNETSGVAIKARQREGDTGTVVYLDNFTRAIRQTGKILIDLIPHVYDTQRTIRIMGEDGKVDLMQINQERDKATGHPILDETGNPVVLNDMTTGAYDVLAEAGASYATRREEARESMLEFVKAAPETGPIMLDMIAAAQDWPMHEKVAKRAKFLLPPPIQKAEAEEEAKNGGEPVPQVEPSPAEQMQQQAMGLELEGKQLDNEKKKVEIASAAKELQGEAPDPVAEIKAQAEAMSLEYSVRENEIKIATMEEELATKRRLDQIKIEIAELDLAKARAGIVQGMEKHEASMTQQHIGMMHGAEKHQASLEQMNSKEGADS